MRLLKLIGKGLKMISIQGRPKIIDSYLQTIVSKAILFLLVSKSIFNS